DRPRGSATPPPPGPPSAPTSAPGLAAELARHADRGRREPGVAGGGRPPPGRRAPPPPPDRARRRQRVRALLPPRRPRPESASRTVGAARPGTRDRRPADLAPPEPERRGAAPLGWRRSLPLARLLPPLALARAVRRHHPRPPPDPSARSLGSAGDADGRP